MQFVCIMFLYLHITVSSCTFNVTESTQWNLLYKYTSVIFCVVAVCVNLMNAGYHLHTIRLEVGRLNPISFIFLRQCGKKKTFQTKRYCVKRTNIHVITLVDL